MTTSDVPRALIWAQLDMESSVEGEFNDWYDTEHIPERLAIPGFRTARRAERPERPRYIALYDLDSLAVLSSEAYLGKQGDRRTPWTARMLRLTKTFSRRLYQQVVPGDEDVRADQPYTVARTVPHGQAERGEVAGYVAHLRREGAAVRLFDGREQAAGEWLVLATTPTTEAADAIVASSALGVVHLYGPYERQQDGKRFAFRAL